MSPQDLPESGLEAFTTFADRRLAPAFIVVVPTKEDIARGFALARQTLSTGASVRLVGDGVTLSSSWPEWVNESTAGLVLTELGAYVLTPRAQSSERLRADIARWLDLVFEGVVPGVRGSEIFYSAAAMRLFQPLLDAMPYVEGLASRHPNATFRCSAEEWQGLQLLRARVKGTGGVVLDPIERPAAGWRLRVLCAAAIALAGAARRSVVSYWRARPSRLSLERLAPRSTTPEPDAWVALIPDWFRINKPLLEAFVRPALTHGLRLGILFIANLEPGLRDENDMTKHSGKAPWLGLSQMRDELLAQGPVEQAASPTNLRSLFRATTRAVVSATGVIRRILMSAHTRADAGFAINLSSMIWPIAKLATLDVFKAVSAAQATLAVASRHDFDGKAVYFASSALADTSTVDVLLQKRGATTIEYFHGSGGEDWIGVAESRAAVRLVATRADAQSIEDLGQKCLVIGRKPPPKVHRLTKRPRVLVTTNYCHRDWKYHGSFPFEVFEREMLRGAEVIRSTLEASVRWRPHPAEDKHAIARLSREFGGIDLSKNLNLEDDLDWSDYVLSSMSTVALRTIGGGIPTFVHVPPALRETPTIECLDRKRIFFTAKEVAGLVADAIVAPTNDLLTPEAEACSKLFDDAGGPDATQFTIASSLLLRR